jgi:hypothetical protein
MPAAAVAGVDDRRVTTIVGLIAPAEQFGEEPFGPLDVARRELVPAPGAHIVDERGADS